MAGTLDTCRLISEGCTKIDAPRIMPATIAAAGNRPIVRFRAAWDVERSDCTVGRPPAKIAPPQGDENAHSICFARSLQSFYRTILSGAIQCSMGTSLL
jgi:hypothetical protein